MSHEGAYVRAIADHDASGVVTARRQAGPRAARCCRAALAAVLIAAGGPFAALPASAQVGNEAGHELLYRLPPVERLAQSPSAALFSPPAPRDVPLLPLEEELWLHGGAHLYEPEGDRRNWPEPHEAAPYQMLRLPEDWQEPRPLTFFSDFLGADPVKLRPWLKWPGEGGYYWEPQVVIYGGYELFGLAFEEDGQRQDGIGHQLLVDLDLRLTGTERFHVQYRPIGERSTGGSFYQFSDPSGYIDNSTGEPDRYWFEAELHSLLGAFVDPFAARDYHVVAGRFPFLLHNALLANDDVLGVVVNKNTLYFWDFSNFNLQAFYLFNDVDTFADGDARLYGTHVSADYRHVFLEMTYAFAEHQRFTGRDAHFAAFSGTRFFGPLTLAARALFKWGSDADRGAGQLLVIESNYLRYPPRPCLGVDYVVFYCNAFAALEGWQPISAGNFDRLRSSFEVNPLVWVSLRTPADDVWGISLGAQIFRCREDESIVPEIAFQSPGGAAVWGAGLRYLRKTGPRSFFQVLGVANFSDDNQFDREGIFISQTILF